MLNEPPKNTKMTEKILFLLEELKDNYTDQIFKDTIECFRDEIHVNDLYKDIEKTKTIINGQLDKFYNELAFDFVEDLNEMPEMYFMFWEPMIYFFNELTKKYFYATALELAHNSDATDYINGLRELENDNSEIALFHFNRIEDYVASYLIAMCYLDTENYENSIKQNEFFLKNLDEVIKNQKEIDLSNDAGILILKWNVFNDLGYAYNRIYEFENALNSYSNSLEIFNLEETYQSKNSVKVDENLDEFILFANNYLLSLERTKKYDKCIEIIDFLISKYPTEFYYKSKKEKLLASKIGQEETEYIFNQVFKPKKPFDISYFQATKLISKEKALEDLIVEQIKYGFNVFEKPLEIYQDENIFGRQYRIIEINGILDLLLIDKKSDQLYIVELKRNEAGVEVVQQIENYITALSKQLNRNIKGIICLHKTNPKLTEMVKTKENIELYTYNFEFTKEK